MIDAHQHVLPGFYTAARRAQGITGSGGSPFPPYDAAGALALPDRQGLRPAVLSVSSPEICFGRQPAASLLARPLNECLATDPAQAHGVLPLLRRFYYDTALAAAPFTLPGLPAVADPARIVFGTDYPYALDPVVAETVRGVREFAGFSDGERQAVLAGNARHLFPNL